MAAPLYQIEILSLFIISTFSPNPAFSKFERVQILSSGGL